MDDTGSAMSAAPARIQTASVLFCDMVGSTELLSRLGVSASEELRRRFNVVLRDAVRATGGEEVKSLGDGLMVVFLHSAGDAVECAVAMQRGIDRLNLENPLLAIALRVGIALGEATYFAEEDDWFGPAVNTAARLCAKARAEQILATSVLVEVAGEASDLFRDVGAFDLKGIPRPVPTVEVLWSRDPPEGQAVPLDAALDAGAGTPFVGRREALAALVARQQAADGGESTAICITGEPGVGKTRLTRELALRAHRDGAVVLYARASTEHQHPIQPLADAMRWYAASLPADELARQLGDLAPDLAELLPGLRYRLPGLARRLVPSADRSAEAAIQLLRGACRRATVLLILDDVHQASPQLPRVLAPLVADGDLRLMIVGLLREDGPTWAGFARALGAASMRLDGLPVDEVAELVRAVVRSDVDDAVVASIHASTVGNPGHVLEVAHNLAIAGTVDAAVVREVIEHTCPYRGLVAYTPTDHALFFGRDELVSSMLGHLTHTRFLAVVGSSGSGKSSAVLAGVVPALERGALPGSDTWPVLVVEPGSEPIGALAAAFAGRAGAGESSVALERTLAGDPQALHQMALRLVDHPSQRVILVVDQLEEVFAAADDAVRDHLLASLLHAAATPGGPVSVVIVLRADFYGQLAAVPGLAPAVEGNQVLVAPMSTSELTEAVTQPAFVAGLRLEEGLADTIVRDAAGQAGALPLVSHALLETWNRRQGRTLTVAAYRDAGGVRAAIARSAEAAYEAHGENDQQRVRSLFLRLVTLGEGSEDTRRRVSIAELPQPLARLVPPLVAARLLTADHETVEVAHEALIREWPRLRAWLDEDRAALRLQRHLTQSASAWEEAGPEPAELYAGARLATAIEWQKVAQPELNEVELRFLAASRRRERSRTRRRHGLIAGMAVLTVAAVLAGAVAVAQRGRSLSAARSARAAEDAAVAAADSEAAARRDAEIEALVGRIGTTRATQRDAAALLAVEAYRLADTPRTRSALLATFTTDPGYLDTHQLPADNDLYFGIVLPDGKQALVTGRDHRIRRYDLNSGAVGDPWPAPTDEELRFTDVLTASADGRLLAQVADNFDQTQALKVTISVYDVLAERPRFAAIELPLTVSNATFSPDGSILVVSGGTDETVIAYDATDGHELGHTSLVAAGDGDPWESSAGLAFVGDRRLAIGSSEGPVRIVDVPAMTEVARFDVQPGIAAHLDALDGGRSLLARGPEGTAVIETATGEQRWFLDQQSVPCERSTLIEQRASFYCADETGRLVERALADGRTTRSLDAQNGAVGSLWPARDGTELVSFGNNETSVTRFRVDGTGPITRRLTPGYVPVGYSPDGRRLAALVPPATADDFEETTVASWGVGGALGEAEAAVLDTASGEVVDTIDGLIRPGLA